MDLFDRTKTEFHQGIQFPVQEVGLPAVEVGNDFKQQVDLIRKALEGLQFKEMDRAEQDFVTTVDNERSIRSG
jgi:hypothetical protein